MIKIQPRTVGQITVPLVLRTPYGRGVNGGLFHSQSGEAYFAHTAGLTVVTPSNPYDANGLLSSAMDMDAPVVFLEPKRLYRSIRAEVPENEYKVEIGKENLGHEGGKISVLTYGSMVPLLEGTVTKNDLDADTLDLRTLVPMDIDSITRTVIKT